jgi:hypothetical protein
MAKSQKELALEAARRLINVCTSNAVSTTLPDNSTSTDIIDFDEPVLLCHNSVFNLLHSLFYINNARLAYYWVWSIISHKQWYSLARPDADRFFMRQ